MPANVSFSISFANEQDANAAVDAFARAHGWVAPSAGSTVPASNQKHLTAAEAANEVLMNYVQQQALQRMGQDAIDAARAKLNGVKSEVKVG